MRWLLFALAGCGGAIEAGDDRRVLACSDVELEGTGPDDAEWSQVSGPTVSIGSPEGLSTTVFLPEAGTYVFELAKGGRSAQVTLDAGFVVDTLDDVVDPDDGRTSLREAVDASNGCPGDQTVVVEGRGTLTLGAPLLLGDDAADVLAVTGSSEVELTGAGTVLQVLGDVRLEGFTITGMGGLVAEPFTRIVSGGRLALAGTIVRDNGTIAPLEASLFALEGGALSLEDVRATNNVGSTTPLIAGTGELVMEEGRYAGNRSTAGNGVLRLEGGGLDVRQAVFEDNRGVDGGAIHVAAGTVTIEEAVFERNEAADGGALYLSGDGLLLDTRFADNVATNSGGALVVGTGGEVQCTRCELRGNEAGLAGGALLSLGVLDVLETAFELNTAALGGAIRASAPTDGAIPTAFRATDSTFLSNTAVASGGALDVQGVDDFALTDTTLTRNTAADGAGLRGFRVPASTLLRTSITENTASGLGGGVAWLESGTLSLTDSPVGANTAQDGGGLYTDSLIELLGASPVADNTATIGFGGGVCGPGFVTGLGIAGNVPQDRCP
jgi:hypothetical protein